MTDIYDQHKAAFAQVEAYVILDSDNERVATIAFKFPRDGAGRLYAYVHWLGLEMVRGSALRLRAAGTTAACADAARKCDAALDIPTPQSDPGTVRYGRAREFFDALWVDSGWERNLRDAGFTVLQAV